MSKLFAAVGAGGTNASVDVKTVQNLINASIRTITPFGYLNVSGVCDGLTIEAIKAFQQRVVKLPAADGRVDPGGTTLRALDITAGGGTYFPGLLPIPSSTGATPATAYPKPGPDGRYTKDPNEVPTKNTVPTAKEVVAMLRAGWSDLTEQGARTLTAQFMHETGGAKYCFNWNLGNAKPRSGPTKLLHMYLRNTWEGLTAHDAQQKVADGWGSRTSRLLRR